MSVVFDKLSFVRRLESDGTFSRPQAETLSEAFHAAGQETVATRDDISRLDASIARLETTTKAEIVRLEGRFDAMDARVDAKLAGVDAKLAGVDAKLAGVDASMANLKVWMVGVGVALFSALSAIRFFGH